MLKSVIIVKNKIILVSTILIFMILLIAGCVETENPNTNTNDVTTETWLDDYTPVHSLGSGDADFWIDHTIDGSITHPQWVIDDLQSNCVVFVVHRHTCAYCDPQAQRVIALSEEYEDSVNFYDLDIDLGGDIEMMGYDSLIYDPNGAPHYIALTGIITLIENDGKVEYAWHAWEGDMTESEIEDWMKDAMYYHSINKGEIL